LYGDGVQVDCGRARQDFLAAAEHSSTKAQSTLGTMYATGHCANRDLPLAYHWFARVQRQEPRNRIIQEDMKALWNQMSPEERRLAER
jgi:TPR repeat protein